METGKHSIRKQILEKWPYIAYLIVMLLIHSAYVCKEDDMTLIQNTLKPTVLEEFSSIAHNFTTWSSRVLVNLPIHIILHFDYHVWLVIELALLFLIIWGLSYIFVTKNQTVNNVVLLCLLLCFPFLYATWAGWVTTTMTYIWPVAVGVFACTSIRKYLDGKPFRWYEYVLYSIATIYAANQEQMSIVLTLVFAGCTIVCLYRKRKSVLIFIQTGCVFANLLFHMFTPGNENRRMVETAVRFPDYNTLSLLDKLELGFTSSMYEFVFQYNALFLLIGLVLVVLVFCKYKNRVYRFIASVPLLAQLVFGVGCEKLLEERLHIDIFTNRLLKNGTIDESNYYQWQTYYPIVLLFIVSICLIIGVYLVFGNSDKSVFAFALLLGGLGGRMILAFSPTIWASSFRTFTTMYFAFIALGIMLVGELDYKALGRKKYILAAVLLLVTAKNVINVFRVFL